MSCSRKHFSYKKENASSARNIDSSLILELSHDNKKNNYYPEAFSYTVLPQELYITAFSELKKMLEDSLPVSIKRAVFITENTYLENIINYDAYCKYVSSLAKIAQAWSKKNPLQKYKYPDSVNTALNGAIFKTLTDTVRDNKGNILNLPYVYDFNDCFARQDWTNMFVTKLLSTHKGNCHSLPFLYKLVAEELRVNVWLSFTPNHIYLRNRCKKTGWYNTEMTNAMFPTEAWVMTSGYVSVNSIVSGIYMDTLGLKQTIVVCLNDLAKGYMRKFTKPDLDFVLKCCDLGLKYYPNYVELLLLKAETHNKIYHSYIAKYGLNVQSPNDPHAPVLKYHLEQMDKTYDLLAKYDYREIPEEMFNEWMRSLENNKEKYEDKKASEIFKPKQK